jgi:hypothetical protein
MERKVATPVCIYDIILEHLWENADYFFFNSGDDIYN